jgi:hypothetical protein
MNKNIIAILAASIALHAEAQRAGRSYVVSSSDATSNTVVPVATYSSVWNVYYGSLTPLYSNFYARTSPCYIAKTGNTYTIKVGAFGKVFTYVQPVAGELNLTKNEVVNTTATSRRILVWSFATNGINASLQCTVEVQTLTKKVWKTTAPASVWLKSYSSVANMQTVL